MALESIWVSEALISLVGPSFTIDLSKAKLIQIFRYLSCSLSVSNYFDY